MGLSLLVRGTILEKGKREDNRQIPTLHSGSVLWIRQLVWDVFILIFKEGSRACRDELTCPRSPS